MANKAISEENKEVKAPKKKDDDRVQMMIPYIEGEDPEVTVGINGVYTKIQKGKVVSVPRPVAKVLQNSNAQVMTTLENQKKFEKQVTDL